MRRSLALPRVRRVRPCLLIALEEPPWYSPPSPQDSTRSRLEVDAPNQQTHIRRLGDENLTFVLAVPPRVFLRKCGLEFARFIDEPHGLSSFRMNIALSLIHLHMCRARWFRRTGPDVPCTSLPSALAYDYMSAIAKRNRSEAEDSVKGVEANH